MLPVRRILAPTDFSSHSLPAVDLAAELAQHFSAELLLLHVINPIPAVMPTGAGQMPLRIEEYRDTVLEDAEKKLEELAGEKIPTGVDLRREVRWGSAAETIIEVADETESGMIVIGTRGATGLARLVIGSVTAKVVRLSDVPVLTVPAADDD